MKLIYKSLALLPVSALVFSCSLIGSIDDIQPVYVLTDETVINDASTAEMALNGMYGSVRSYDVGVFRSCLSLWAGTFANTNVPGSSDFLGNDKNETSIKVENASVEGAYRGYYYVINTVNSFIANLAKSHPADLSETRKNEMLGEARCMRALMNMHLLRLFGQYYDTDSAYGIVLYEEPVRGNLPRTRSKVSDCYKLIEEDLRFASVHAPASPSRHALLSSSVAKALMARVYLTKGENAKAAQWAGEVIDEASANGYALEPTFLAVFNTQFDSPEMLYAPYVNRASSEYVKSAWRGTSPGRLLTALARSMGTDGKSEPRYAATYEKIANVNRTAKYPHIESNTDVNSYYFMRLTEVYYIRAEAEARLGHYAEARRLLRPLCDRAGYAADYVDKLEDAAITGMILKNKLMELSVENGEEWFDLVRYHLKGGFEHWSEQEKAVLPAFNQLILPIPRTALGGNDLLVQNPEYQSKTNEP